MLHPAVSISQLTKYYGRIKAVENLTIEIPEGSVFGILGPNGSGKTTTLGMLLDVLNPTRGTYLWFNSKSNTENRRKIGSLLEIPSFYPYLSAVMNLKIIAEIKKAGLDRIDEVLATVGLHERRNSPYRTFSLGMKQRLALAAALLSDPPLLILDEPTNGLDPIGIAEIRDIIIAVAKQGKTVILASHLLDEVQKVCSHFCILDKGRLVYSGLVSDVSETERRVELGATDMELLKKTVKAFPSVIKYEEEDDRVVVLIPVDKVIEISQFLTGKGIIITHFLIRRKSLEKQFLDILTDQQ
ncbi:MAG: ATP-binding cassette domain-containing protein [Bacteroidales bacterium]|nr:ATP-binding cassette domain-containing protein [Bacteroidales bacterium]